MRDKGLLCRLLKRPSFPSLWLESDLSPPVLAVWLYDARRLGLRALCRTLSPSLGTVGRRQPDGGPT